VILALKNALHFLSEQFLLLEKQAFLIIKISRGAYNLRKQNIV